ncbi:MAG: D-alanyl-D-alanine carboxypeptidase [Spirochaetaceae bacterium]|nr:D-alanyl-D-alanine carboxypeptidase [Spirochaetaceae bacterium]
MRISIGRRLFCTFFFVFISLSLFAQNPPELSATSVVLVDHLTGRVLYQKDASISFPPASMTKLVTLYLCYEAIEEGHLQKDQVIQVTPVGSSFSRPTRSSLMMLEEGQQVDVLTLMKGVAVSSGNDAAYQLAELVAGSPEAFVLRMNGLMEEMGFQSMSFIDPDGWSEENQVSALDYAKFASNYINRFPQALEELHSVPSLAYPQPENFAGENAQIQWTRVKKNTNLLLGVIDGVDGLKTGYIDESGFNFACTAKRSDTRLISVVMGIFTDNYLQGLNLRATETRDLLEWGFETWKTEYAPLGDISQRIWMSSQERVDLEALNHPMLTLSDSEKSMLVELVELDTALTAPVNRGTKAGHIQWYLNGKMLAESDLVTTERVSRGNLLDIVLDLFPMIHYKITHGRNR